MSLTLVLNSSNVIGSNNNTFQYKFMNGNFKLNENAKMAISQITIPYSWYNITSLNNNKTFNITWVNAGAGMQTYTIPDGFYTVSDLNAYIQQICIANGFYLIDSNGDNYYYIVLSTNTNYYKVQLLLMNVPMSLPTGWTAPSNFAGYSFMASITPTFSLDVSGSIASIIGFLPGFTRGGYAEPDSSLSTLTPNITPVNSLIVRCNLVNNLVAIPSDILDAIPINTTFGSNINYVPNYEKWVKLSSGTYNSFNISFSDQNLNQLYSLDPNVSITLLIDNSN